MIELPPTTSLIQHDALDAIEQLHKKFVSILLLPAGEVWANLADVVYERLD